MIIFTVISVAAAAGLGYWVGYGDGWRKFNEFYRSEILARGGTRRG
jgi:hypothetical protein